MRRPTRSRTPGGGSGRAAPAADRASLGTRRADDRAGDGRGAPAIRAADLPDGERAITPGRGGWPRRLGETLPETLEKLGLGPLVEDARIFADWESAVGSEIARVARPHRLDAGTLIVHVKHSGWMAELSLRRSELLERVNHGRTRRSIRQIIFRIDPGMESELSP